MRHRVLTDEPMCRVCKAKGRLSKATEVDHIVPLHKGGAGMDRRNLQGVCADCHRDKTNEEAGYKRRVAVGVDGWPVE
jgi:5-methylcytosine-specific restriction protein A